MLQKIVAIGHQSSDSENLRIQKSFLVYLAMFMSVGGIVWGAICLYYGLYFQAIFPLSYFGISIINMLIFKFSKHFGIVRFIQTFISLALPFVFQWSLGGFDASGSIMWWAVLSVIASLSFQSVVVSVRWLFFYILLTVLSAVYDERAQAMKPEVLPSNSILFVSINLILISSIVFALVVYFVEQYKHAELSLAKERDFLKKSNMALERSHMAMKKAFDQEHKSKEKLESQLAKEGKKQMEFYEQILEEQRKMLGRIS